MNGIAQMEKVKMSSYVFVNILFLLYSFVGVCFKNISTTVLWSVAFFAYLGMAFLLLFIYALLWQQVLKRLPLSVAFANKGVTVMWGMLWGALFFQERITIPMVMGAFFICAGIVLVTCDNGM